MRTIYIYGLIIFLFGCNSEPVNIVENSLTESDTLIDTTRIVEEEIFHDFPIPNLEDIFPFYETSGMGENAPSEKYFNPTDSGIFVYYSLFDKEKIKQRTGEDAYIGSLTTHTYYKKNKGWSTSDTDQTFIQIDLNSALITIGESIKVGATVEELFFELGKPIAQSDEEITFLGKNFVVGKFQLKNSKVTSFKYGRYNLPIEIFEADSLKQVQTVDSIVGI
jgi:hypothetical protein